jgi:hypothetical protein
MIDVGRNAASDPAVAGLLEAMERGGFYERFLSLLATSGSRDQDRVVRAVADPSLTIRSLAARLAPILCDDDRMRAVLAAAPRSLLRKLLVGLRERGRLDVVDDFLDGLAERGDASLVKYLPLGSSAAVERHFAASFELANFEDWRRLARYHADLASARLAERPTPPSRSQASCCGTRRSATFVSASCRATGPRRSRPSSRARATTGASTSRP